jgi:hypothetical protein
MNGSSESSLQQEMMNHPDSSTDIEERWVWRESGLLNSSQQMAG